jgi:hypothetical protein
MAAQATEGMVLVGDKVVAARQAAQGAIQVDQDDRLALASRTCS